MLPSRSLIFLNLLGLCLLAGGCASVENRIEQNAEQFRTFPKETQLAIREGRIQVGFTQEMVEIAKGPPTYITQRVAGSTESELWRYTSLHQYTRYQPVYVSGRYRGRNSYTDWIEVTQHQEIEVLRVEFTNGRVTSYEETRL